MLLNNEITSLVESVLTNGFKLQDSPVTFYSKNGLNWIKVSLVYQNDVTEIRYAYHGFLNDQGQFKSRDCFSKRQLEISNQITDSLNRHEIGKKMVD